MAGIIIVVYCVKGYAIMDVRENYPLQSSREYLSPELKSTEFLKEKLLAFKCLPDLCLFDRR